MPYSNKLRFCSLSVPEATLPDLSLKKARIHLTRSEHGLAISLTSALLVVHRADLLRLRLLTKDKTIPI